MSSKTEFDEQTRRNLRLALRANGVSVHRAPIIVDLACHATVRSVDSLFDACRSAPDASMMLLALELALQLSRARMEAILGRTHDLGASMGGERYSAAVGMRL